MAVKQIEEYRKLCDQYNQQSVSIILTHQLQLCFNLMGINNKSSSSVDPLVLTGDAMDETETIQALGGKHPVSLAWIWFMKHLLAVYFGQFEIAKNMALNVKPSLSFLGSVLPFVPYTHLFLEGVAAAASSKSNNNKTQGTKRAMKILDQLKSDRHVTCRNFDNKIALIEAELANSRDDRDLAMTKYTYSIEAARRDEFVHEQALASELAGRALLQWSETQTAYEYLESARCLYHQWGATAKVKQLEAFLLEQKGEMKQLLKR